MQEIRRSPAWERARRLVASVYGATQPWAAAPPPAIQALRRASVAAAVSLLESAGAPRPRALAALEEVARQARLCRQAGHLPEAEERALLAEEAAVRAALWRDPADTPQA